MEEVTIDNIRKTYFGDRAFYRHVIVIALPMILQNLITNFVTMLDNIMVGQVGTAEMSGVSIVNQFIFVFHITLFGGMSGASIFGTQFFGKRDHEGQRYTVRFRLYLAAALVAAGCFIFSTCGTQLIRLFLSDADAPEKIDATLGFGRQYMDIMMLSLIPFSFGQVYASALNECGETKVPMYGAMSAVGLNLVLDYVLIFGKCGFPVLGVRGAAWATLIAKSVEAAVMVLYAHRHIGRFAFLKGLYSSPVIPRSLNLKIIHRGLPLLFNEFLWSLSMSVIAQCYSVRGIDVVAARNIASTLNNLFSVVFVQLGTSTGIIVGALLGAGELEKAVSDSRKLRVFSVWSTFLLGGVMIPLAYWFPQIYNTEPEIRSLAGFFILIQATSMPFWAYTNSCYFTLRCGGKTGVTFLFDFLFSWAVMIPLCAVLVYCTALDVRLIFALVTFSEAIKAVIGWLMVRSRIWVNVLVEDGSV